MCSISTDPDETEVSYEVKLGEFDFLDANVSDAAVLDYMVLHLCRNFDPSRWLLKGGYAMTKIFGEEARKTRDIDFDILQEDKQRVSLFFNEMGEHLLGLGVIVDYAVREPTTYSVKVIFKRPSGQKNQTRTAAGCDIHFHEQHNDHVIDLFGYGVNVSTPEHMLADKMRASQGDHPEGRMKDFYDIYLLSDTFGFKMVEILDCLRREEFVYDRSVYPFAEEMLEKLETAWRKTSFTRLDLEFAEKIEWSLVARRYDQLVNTIVNYYEEGVDPDVVWDVKSHYWKG